MKHSCSIVFRLILLAAGLMLAPCALHAQNAGVPPRRFDPTKPLNPNTRWLREARWGLFSHYMAHMPSGPIPADMNGEKWNKKVDSFQTGRFAAQLTELRVPYFFITIGQGGGYYCAPNGTYERLFGPSERRLSKRDLVAELGKELTARGIRLGVYLPALGRNDPPDRQQMYREVITEWSQRWGRAVSAWWIDGARYQNSETFKAFTAAFKSGNPDAIVAYNAGPAGMNRQQLVPATEHEDFLAGECDYLLPTCGRFPEVLVKGRHFNSQETTDYYQGPNILGDQLHFLTFLGSWWSTGEPRFFDDLVIAWTRHVAANSGAVTWDLPLSDEGLIPEAYFRQVKALSEGMNHGR